MPVLGRGDHTSQLRLMIASVNPRSITQRVAADARVLHSPVLEQVRGARLRSQGVSLRATLGRPASVSEMIRRFKRHPNGSKLKHFSGADRSITFARGRDAMVVVSRLGKNHS